MAMVRVYIGLCVLLRLGPECQQVKFMAANIRAKIPTG